MHRFQTRRYSINEQQKQKSRYRILEWHSRCTLHSAIHRSREIFLFDKDRDTKRGRKKGKRIWQDNFTESGMKKMLNSWDQKLLRIRPKGWPPIVQIASMSHIYVSSVLTECTVRYKICSHFFFFIDVLIKMFNRSMGHFLFQSIFYLSVIFKTP